MSTVKNIINKWDPINLLSHAPEDEYQFEIVEVENLLRHSNDPLYLASGIYTVFKTAFGENFVNTKDECMQIARRILSQLQI